MARYEFEGRIPRVAPSAYIAPSAQVIGDVDIGPDCYIGHGAILRGDYGSIVVGAGTAVEEGVIVHARPDDRTTLGRRVTLGHGAMVHNATVEDGAVIGMRATISDFSVVGAGAIVGEAALVRQRQKIPPRAIAVGVPARVVDEVSDDNADMTVWAKELYVDLAHRYPSGLREIPELRRDDEFVLRPIGVIHTPFDQPEGTPIQGAFSGGAPGKVEVKAQYAAGLADLEGFSHVVLLYAFHRSSGYELAVTPYMDDRQRGLFSTRAPRRPNPLGMTAVGLERIDGRVLHVSGVDMLDGTPLLDIKPYAPLIDQRDSVACGWMDEALAHGGPDRRCADGRFHQDVEES